MEAYGQHLNKLKVPDVVAVDPHPESGIPPTGEVSTHVEVVKDTVRVTGNPATGETVEERIQIQRTPNLQEHAEVSSESSLSSDEGAHGPDGKKKKSGIKKLGSKISTGFKKLVGKKSHSEDVHHESTHHGHHESGHHGHHSSHHTEVKHTIPATVSYGDNHGFGHHSASDHQQSIISTHETTVKNTTTNPDILAGISGQPSTSSPLTAPLSGTASDRVIQHNLGTAYATEGMNATRHESTTVTRNRFETSPEARNMDIGKWEDIQDHSALTTSKDAHSSSFGSEKYTQPSLAMRQTEGIRSPPRTSGNVVTSAKFESVDVRPVAADDGRLIRSSEEWNLGPGDTGTVETVGEVKKHGEEFSDKFEKIGQHRNSLTGSNSSSPPGRSLIEPQLSLPEHRDDYDSRLGSLQQKLGTSATEERVHTLLRSTQGIISPPPSLKTELHNLSASQGTNLNVEKSESNLTRLTQETTPQSFERVSSVAGLERGAPLAADIAPPYGTAQDILGRSTGAYSGSVGGHHLRSVAALGLTPQAQGFQSPALPAGDNSAGLRTLRDISTVTTVTDTVAPLSPPHVPLTPHNSHADFGVSTGQQCAVGPSLDSALKGLSLNENSKPPVRELGDATSAAGFNRVPLSSPMPSSVDMLHDSHQASSANTEHFKSQSEAQRTLQKGSPPPSFEMSEEPSPVEQKGLFTSVVETVAGAVGNVVGIMQAKAAEASAAEDEYLPFEVKEKTEDVTVETKEHTSSAGEGRRGSIMDSMMTGIDNVMHSTVVESMVDTVKAGTATVMGKMMNMVSSGKETTEGPVAVEQTVEVKEESREPVMVLPISGEFITPVDQQTQKMVSPAEERGIGVRSVQKTEEERTTITPLGNQSAEGRKL